MAYPDLPASVKTMLAAHAMREHHLLWHLVRIKRVWDNLTAADRQQFTNDGWKAPRFGNEAGAGVDFLAMHRNMIAHVNQALATAADPQWPSVIGWNPIPWTLNDADWPVPNWANAPQEAIDARSAASVATIKSLVETHLQKPSYLASISLDKMGSEIEWSIHGWMHMRWSGPPFSDQRSDDPANDWLYDPVSSHVNKTYWKLHGWIDARISDWEAANSATANLSSAWTGPPMHHVRSLGTAEGVSAGTGIISRLSAGVARRSLFNFSLARARKILGTKTAKPAGHARKAAKSAKKLAKKSKPVGKTAKRKQ